MPLPPPPDLPPSDEKPLPPTPGSPSAENQDEKNTITPPTDKSYKPFTDHRKVSHVRVVIYELPTPDSYLNHWTTFLFLHNTDEYVHLDMHRSSPSDPKNLTGKLSWIPFPSTLEGEDEDMTGEKEEKDTKGIKFFDYKVKKGKNLKVEDVYAVIVNGDTKMDKYRFVSGKAKFSEDWVDHVDVQVEGDGARFWCYTAIKDLDEKGYLLPYDSDGMAQTPTQHMWETIHERFSGNEDIVKKDESHYLAVLNGVFYQEMKLNVDEE